MQEKEQKISPIKQRILIFAKELGVSKREFYKTIGVSRGTLESKTGITEDVLAKFIATYPEVSTEWLLSGKGDMIGKKFQCESPNQKLTPLYNFKMEDSLSQVLDGVIEPVDYLYFPSISAHAAFHMPYYPNLFIISDYYYFIEKVDPSKVPFKWGDHYFLSIKNCPYIVFSDIEPSNNPTRILVRGWNITELNKRKEVDIDSIISLAHVVATVTVSTPRRFR